MGVFKTNTTFIQFLHATKHGVVLQVHAWQMALLLRKKNALLDGMFLNYNKSLHQSLKSRGGKSQVCHVSFTCKTWAMASSKPSHSTVKRYIESESIASSFKLYKSISMGL